MRAVGAQRGRHDDRKRGADAQLHPHGLGHAQQAEYLKQHWDDDGAAADAEQPGQHAGRDAGDQGTCRQQRNFANHCSPWCSLFGWRIGPSPFIHCLDKDLDGPSPFQCIAHWAASQFPIEGIAPMSGAHQLLLEAHYNFFSNQ